MVQPYPATPRVDTVDYLRRRLQTLESYVYQLNRSTQQRQGQTVSGQFKLSDVATQLPAHGDLLRWNNNTGLWEPVTLCTEWTTGSTPTVANGAPTTPRDDMVVTGFSMRSTGGSSTVVLQRNGSTIATVTGSGYQVSLLATPVRVLGGADTYQVNVTATSASGLAGEIQQGSAQSLP